jgi:hypothetical protein
MPKTTLSSKKRRKRPTREAALRLLVQTRAQISISHLRGKIQWDGDLDRSRLDGSKKRLDPV